MEAKGKVWVVTGAGAGLGRELAIQILNKGALGVLGVDLNESGLEETKDLLGDKKGSFIPIVMDITDNEAVLNLPSKVTAFFGQVDGLINNAGIIQAFKPVNELSLDEIRKVININFFGTLYLTKAFLPHFTERPEAHIVNISSMGGFMPFPKQTIYGASKAAVKLLTEGLYAELIGSQIKATVVFPGAVATNITENSGLKPTPDKDSKGSAMALEASKAAQIIIKGIEKDKYKILVGRDARILDFFYKLHPTLAIKMVNKMMKKMEH